MYGYIYLIINKVNGHSYVGQHKSNDFNDDYMGSGKLLKYAMKKYGKDNFEKFKLQSCWSKEEMNKQEVFWIAEYRSRGKAEYNIADGGEGGLVAPIWNKGKKCPSLSGENNSFYGMHWYTNGEINVMCKECPNGFIKGRILNEHSKR